MSDLKPCPFCGGEATVEYAPTGPVHRAAHVGCLEGCKTRFTVWSKDDSEAADPEAISAATEAWNRRAPVSDEERVEGWCLSEEVLPMGKGRMFRIVVGKEPGFDGCEPVVLTFPKP